jgi:hypothetical protein
MMKTEQPVTIDDVLTKDREDHVRWLNTTGEWNPEDALTALSAMVAEIIGEDIDIPAEMEKVGRDFQKLDAIAKTGGLLNKHKADLRQRAIAKGFVMSNTQQEVGDAD